MYRTIITIAVLLTTIVVVIWAATPFFVTYAQIAPTDIVFEVGDKESVERALAMAASKEREHFRTIHYNSFWPVSVMAVLNAILAVWLSVGRNKDKKYDPRA